MVTIIISIIIGICWGNYIVDRYYDSIKSTLATIACIALGVVIGNNIDNKTKTIVDTYELELLQDNSGTGSQLYIGNNASGGNYVYYCKTDDGFRAGECSYDNTVIKYTNDTPRIEIYREVIVKGFVNNFSLKPLAKDSTVIYVPKGTSFNR